ncbi:TPA: hypothetical protein QCJ61_004490 [Enterobacter asburiae]|nr:hypothetical protein [Enterobacter asburiae]HDR2806566.1 hypothetical protein [Enterobacter asburiae]HDR2812048.1 hypothetical protein [Enterobacter asburiae]HDR2817489.1 hypothetical protein [Enterobacter asburiae]
MPISLSTLIRTSQRRMNQCIARDAITGSPLRRHCHFLQVTSICIAGYGSMLFPVFLLSALPDCILGDNEVLTMPGVGVFESQCPWYSISGASLMHKIFKKNCFCADTDKRSSPFFRCLLT